MDQADPYCSSVFFTSELTTKNTKNVAARFPVVIVMIIVPFKYAPNIATRRLSIHPTAASTNRTVTVTVRTSWRTTAPPGMT